MAKKKKQLRLLLKLLAKLQSKLAKLQSMLAKLLKKLLPLLLMLPLLLTKLLLLLAKLPLLLVKLLTLLLLLLPSNSGSRNKKNRPSGRFFFACVSRKSTKASKTQRPLAVFGKTANSNWVEAPPW